MFYDKRVIYVFLVFCAFRSFWPVLASGVGLGRFGLNPLDWVVGPGGEVVTVSLPSPRGCNRGGTPGRW